MGRHNRAQMEQLRQKESIKKKIQIGATGIALAGAAIVGYNVIDGGQSNSAKAAQIANHNSEKARRPMSQDLQDALKAIATTDSPVDKLIGMPYEEVLSSKLGDVNLRIIQTGEQTSKTRVSDEYLKNMKEHYELFSNFARSGAKLTLPIVEADSSGNVIANRTAQAHPAARQKDIIVFLVPTAVDIGTYGGEPTTFTDPDHYSSTVSFVRPDWPAGEEGFITEACQATIDMIIDNETEFPEVSRAKIQTEIQEEVCNSLGDAIGDNKLGVPFSAYVQRRNKARLGHTEPAGSQNNDFVGSIPFINDERVYRQIQTVIPANLGDNLAFPPVVESGPN